jgi:hypothetical protein
VTGRQVFAALIAIALATAVLPPLAALTVNKRRVGRCERDAAALAARLRALPAPADSRAVSCTGGRLPEAGSTSAQPWVGTPRDATAALDGLAVPPDPWGNCYLVGSGWVLSAGPNGIVDTPFGVDRAQGDDVGVKISR